ncbi:MAG: ADP-ribosylglycohydrolase family protein, partial [Lentisphaeraceae bacterium]|nr:ADP-ribosylglycohydrolase family protein [Lentisphaeraceae bacterium]
GVDGAIHKAAGPELLEECRLLNGCKAGNAKITKAYNLPARHVIHTVGPVWQGGHNNESQTLENCYINSLNLALENNLNSIAFPAISCGVYGYPIEKAAQIAVQSCKSFLESNPNFDITFCLFSDADLQIYQNLLNADPFACNLEINDRILGSLYGAAVGDALGVPFEFITRDQLQDSPVTGMRGHGTHNQSAGTWSDDTSLTLCTISSLLEKDFDVEDIMDRFARWYSEGYLACHGKVFDIGNATKDAISRYKAGKNKNEWGCKSDWQNGNGSLMRMLPVCLYTLSEMESFALDKSFVASGITHAHPRSKIGCGYFTLLIRKLVSAASLVEALDFANKEMKPYIPESEEDNFARIIDKSILTTNEDDIQSSSYIIHTLEASLYCLHQTSNFSDAVLKAVNLGDDTDTTACITGALAGMMYGRRQIPEKWIDHLAEGELLKNLYFSFADKVCSRKIL